MVNRLFWKFFVALQWIIQEFNLGVGSHVSITLWCKLCSWGVWRVAIRPTVSPPVLLYITSRFAYMKHLFCWQLILIFLYLTLVDTPLSAGGGVEPPTKFSKGGRAWQDLTFRGVCWERGGWLFSGGCNFHIKN